MHALLLAAAVTGAIVPPLSPRNANYTITAQLDPQTRTITGSETITWRNITSRPAADLQFHLYWNAWKNDKSTFMRSRRPCSPRGRLVADRRDVDHGWRYGSHRSQAVCGSR